MKEQKPLLIKEQKGAKYLGKYARRISKSAFNRQPMWQLKDGRVFNLLGYVINLKDYKKLS